MDVYRKKFKEMRDKKNEDKSDKGKKEKLMIALDRKNKARNGD